MRGTYAEGGGVGILSVGRGGRVEADLEELYYDSESGPLMRYSHLVHMYSGGNDAVQ